MTKLNVEGFPLLSFRAFELQEVVTYSLARVAWALETVTHVCFHVSLPSCHRKQESTSSDVTLFWRWIVEGIRKHESHVTMYESFDVIGRSSAAEFHGPSRE